MSDQRPGNSGKNSNSGDSDADTYIKYCASICVFAVLGACGYIMYNSRKERIEYEKKLRRDELREAARAKQNNNSSASQNQQN